MTFVIKQFSSDRVQVTVLEREEQTPKFAVMTIFRDMPNRRPRVRDFDNEQKAVENAEDTFVCYR